MRDLPVTAPEQQLYVDELKKSVNCLANSIFSLSKKVIHCNHETAKEMIKLRVQIKQRKLDALRETLAKESALLKR